MAEFARKELERYGWKEGAGLGKKEDGRSQPIKVSLKMDKTGVGHDPGKEFTDHWWLRVFNEAAQKIGTKKQVSAASEDQAKLKQDKKAEDRKNFYRGFVKSSTLTNGVEKRDEKSDSSSEDEESQIVTNSVPTLDDIHKFCGGATGHRAARFGIKMKGKLARVAHHDKLYEELSKAAPKDSSSSMKSSDDNVDPTDSILATDLCEKVEDDKRSKKKEKKKKKNKQCIDDVSEDTQVLSETDSGANEKQKKKKRKKDKPCLEDVSKETKVTSEVIPHSPEMDSGANEKQKKKKKYLGDVGEHTDVNTENTPGASETDCSENVKQKKKKRKEEDPPTVNDTDNKQVIVDNGASIRLQDVKSKDGSRKRQKTENSTESVETTCMDGKRKKKHKRKRDVEDKSVQEDSCITAEDCDVKKKKKRKKDKV